MADHRGDQPTGDAAGGSVTPAFAEAAEPIDPAPALRFLDLCTSDDGEATVLVRTQAGHGDEAGVAVARGAADAWCTSDSLKRPDPGRPTGRAAVVARLQDLLVQPVGV